MRRPVATRDEEHLGGDDRDRRRRAARRSAPASPPPDTATTAPGGRSTVRCTNEVEGLAVGQLEALPAAFEVVGDLGEARLLPLAPARAGVMSPRSMWIAPVNVRARVGHGVDGVVAEQGDIAHVEQAPAGGFDATVDHRKLRATR